MTASDLHEYEASLRVVSDKLRLAELTAVLGEPTDGTDKGDPVSRSRPEGPKRPRTRWGFTSHAARTQPLDEHIEEIVAYVEAHREAFDSVRPQVRMDIFCGIFSADGSLTMGGFTLAPDLLRRLVDLGLPVRIEVY
jgi:hypothetical protein